MNLCSGPCDQRRHDALEERRRRQAVFCVDLCGRVLERRPNHEDALAAAAGHLTSLGYYAAGLALDRRLVMLRPRDPCAVYNLACSLSLVGKAEEALAALERAVALGYLDAGHMEDDGDLAPLRGDPRFRELADRARQAAAGLEADHE